MHTVPVEIANHKFAEALKKARGAANRLREEQGGEKVKSGGENALYLTASVRRTSITPTNN